MKCIFTIICFQFQLTFAYITYASGTFALFDYVHYSFWLYHQNTYQSTLTFPDIFANEPKVILFSKYYDMDPANNEFTINITSISKTQCTFFVTATWLNWQRTYSYIFNWVAIDDKRIEVIDCFNYNFTNTTDQNISFSHSNINALYGFITTTSFGYLGAINYSLTIQSITLDTVIVSFKTSGTKLLSIGFQIVLGTPEAFNYSSIFSQQITSSIFYFSANLSIPTNYELFMPFSGMIYDNAKNIRLNQTVNLTTKFTNYTLWCWGTSYLNLLSHQQVWMNKQNTKYYYPFLFKKMRASRLFSRGLDQFRWKLYISELNQLYTNTNTQKLFIGKNIKTLTLKYSYQCIPNGRAQGTILQCPTCLNQYKSFNQYCYKDINLITYYINLYQSDQINEYIDLFVTNQGFSITETVKNQNGSTTYTVMNVTISI